MSSLMPLRSSFRLFFLRFSPNMLIIALPFLHFLPALFSNLSSGRLWLQWWSYSKKSKIAQENKRITPTQTSFRFGHRPTSHSTQHNTHYTTHYTTQYTQNTSPISHQPSPTMQLQLQLQIAHSYVCNANIQIWMQQAID
jgi:hypothetical protein